MAQDSTKIISIRGARTHNLQNISLDIPRDAFIVVTGLSGSGKSSLAFDTLYAEGQRRYIESLSVYARQFLGQMVKPDVDHIEGLPPTIAIAQQAGRSNPRSTVATVTEIHDYLRLLFARVGQPHCPKCGLAVGRQTVTQIVDQVLSLPEGTRLLILAPLVRQAKGDHADTLERLQREGFVRARIDGEVLEAKSAPPLDKSKPHTVEAVVDRLVIRPDMRTRFAESIETALRIAEGLVVVSHEDSAQWHDSIFTTRYACTQCNLTLPEIEPRLFSFNSPHGACPKCDGLGNVLEFDPDLVVPDQSLALENAIAAWRGAGQHLAGAGRKLVLEFCAAFGVLPASPFTGIPPPLRQILLFGKNKAGREGPAFEGVIPHLEARWRDTGSDKLKDRLHAFMSEQPCTACAGARLRPESLAVQIDGRNIHDDACLSIDAAAGVFNSLRFDGDSAHIAAPILREIRQRLAFLIDVGIGYLTLNRTAGTLSGGEAQRIRLATQIGSGLVGVCYVLDEPTTGLHQRDTARLIQSLHRLRELGNTLIVVEHDRDVIDAAEWIIDIGPGAGAHGGRVLANGPKAVLLDSTESITAKYLRGELSIPAPPQHRTPPRNKAITIKGASQNNLKSIDVRIPLGVFSCVTGVSGSGKSTLINQILLPALRSHLYGGRQRSGAHREISGMSHIDKVIEIDQSPIGRSARSNPATYTGIFDHIRDLFSKTREAKLRGYSAARFSFNARGGRCEACQGQGTRRIEMHFLPDIFVTCAECRGTRYGRETLDIRFRGKNISDMLEMRVEDALACFDSFAAIKQLLQAMMDVGLGYLALGQPSNMLSGGEAQRIKLAAELGKSSAGHTLYVLDEPTTGLHFADIHRLLAVLNRLCDQGHTILCIEHNLDVIKQADWIIDLGPEGGEAGGRLVAEGPPEHVAAVEESHTGRYLKPRLHG